MKIAFLETDREGFQYTMAGLAKGLLDRGHEVVAFYQGDVPPEDYRVRLAPGTWYHFDLAPLESFSPDRVVVFNGYHPHIYAACRIIEKKWKTFYMEHAWLPQSEFNYVDPKGPGARGHIFKDAVPRGDERQIKQTMQLLKTRYKPNLLEYGLPKDYIFVPLQLPRDTSIIHDSPYFKCMSDLVYFVKKHFPDYPIVVKAHPRDDQHRNFDGVTMMPPHVPATDISFYARAVVGINSTCLIESLVHCKPIASLGYNVASGKGVFLEPDVSFENPRKVLDWSPSEERIGEVLDYLYRKQFHRLTATKAVLDLILGE